MRRHAIAFLGALVLAGPASAGGDETEGEDAPARPSRPAPATPRPQPNLGSSLAPTVAAPDAAPESTSDAISDAPSNAQDGTPGAAGTIGAAGAANSPRAPADAAAEAPAAVTRPASPASPASPATPPRSAADRSGSSVARANDPKRRPRRAPAIDLSRIETDDMRLLYFAPAQTYLTPYIGASFVNARAYNSRMFGWKPWEKTTVLLKDFSDYGNAAARASPNNALMIDVAPISLAFETFSPGERFYTLANHETTHVALMDLWNGRDAFWRRVFGGKPMPEQAHPVSILYDFLAAPRVNVPRWHLEGAAVFMETWMAGGFGRAQGAYDEMAFRAMVRDGAHFYSPVGLESEGVAVDFQVGVNDYLYGTRFFSYLALTYGPEKVIEWLRRDEDSAGYYLGQFRRVFGKRLNDAWDDWISFEAEFQRANLAALRAFPETPVEPLAPRGLGSVSRAFLDPATGELIGAFRYPGVIAHIGALAPETGKVRKIADIDGAMLYRVTSLAFDPKTRRVWHTTDNYAFRDIVEIDLASGKRRTVLKDARIGDLVFNPRDGSLWGVRHLNGYATIVRVPPPYDRWTQVKTFDFGVTPFDLDVSPDGARLSASVGAIDGAQSVEVYRIDGPAQTLSDPIARYTLGASTPEGFVFSPDGKHLYGSAYYTGVSNIYRIDLETGAIEAMTNASTGLFRPIPQADGSLIAFEYAGDGFRPGRLNPQPLDDLGAIRFLGAEVAERHPVVKEWTAGAPDRADYDRKIVSEGKYVPREELRLGAAYPVIEGYRGAVAFGYHAVFEDPLQFNRLKLTLSYSPETSGATENWHADVEWKTPRWRLRYWHNDADFYDLFGPTKRARAGDAAIVAHQRTFIFDPPREFRLDAEIAHFRGLDTLPAAQAISTPFRNLTSARAGLTYSDVTKSLGAVDHEKGIRWTAEAALDYANEQVFPSVRAGFDFGRPLPIPNSSVWLYSAAGYAGGDRTSPLASFYFGGFGNNYVDNREVKRYREHYSFPGFEINEIDGRSFLRSVAEWNLPPLRFEDVGAPSAYLSSARPALFVGGLLVDRAVGGAKSYQTIGAQIDFSFTVAHRLPMVFSVGYARGFEDGRSRGGEALVSLKIM